MAPTNNSSTYSMLGTMTTVSEPKIDSSSAPAKILPNNRKPNDRIFEIS